MGLSLQIHEKWKLARNFRITWVCFLKPVNRWPRFRIFGEKEEKDEVCRVCGVELARLDLVAQIVKFLADVVRHFCWLLGKVPLYAVKTWILICKRVKLPLSGQFPVFFTWKYPLWLKSRVSNKLFLITQPIQPMNTKTALVTNACLMPPQSVVDFRPKLLTDRFSGENQVNYHWNFRLSFRCILCYICWNVSGSDFSRLGETCMIFVKWTTSEMKWSFKKVYIKRN